MDFPFTADPPPAFALSTNNNIVGKSLSTSCENVKNVPLLSVYSVTSDVGDVPDVREAAGASRTPESHWNSLRCFMEEPDSTAQGATRVHAQGVRGKLIHSVPLPPATLGMRKSSSRACPKVRPYPVRAVGGKLEAISHLTDTHQLTFRISIIFISVCGG